jgi:multisubunit Na+/H+ antiporter MnhF subunit
LKEFVLIFLIIFQSNFSIKLYSAARSGRIDKHQYSTLYVYSMIDTWLFAALCLIFLSICAVVRILPGPTRFDQFVAINTAITLAAGAALAFSVSLGNLIVLDASIALLALCFAGTIAFVRYGMGDKL